MKVIYTAAHGGFSREAVPLGGGGAVCDHLVEEWKRTRPFSLQLVTPSILGESAPEGRDLVAFGERDYARFCREFERATTKEILRHDPQSTVVLANDIAEGPDFAALAAQSFRVFTIYHVDVVAYVAAIYLHGWIKPETSVRWHRRLRPLLPALTRLIWDKQAASVRYSRRLIVPSQGMRNVLLRCYPECPSSKIQVLPWGTWSSAAEPGDSAALRAEYNLPADAQVLLTLSRISPEKGQDHLLEALLDWEKRDDFPSRPLWLFICGGAAYMQGRRFLERLKSLAARLRRTRVVFPGHVTGARKQGFFALADLYVFPSRHESYGLTLLEALAAGLPAVCLEHEGAREIMSPRFGELVPFRDLRSAIVRLLADDSRRREMGIAARAFARTQRFEDRAAELAGLLQSLTQDPRP